MRPKKKTHKKSQERFEKVQVELFGKVAKDFPFHAVNTGEFRFKITAASETSRKNLARIARMIEPDAPLDIGSAAVALLCFATSLFREDEDNAEIDPTETIASVEATTANTCEIELHHESVRRTVVDLANKRDCTTAEAVEILLQGGATVLAMQETLVQPHIHGDRKIH